MPPALIHMLKNFRLRGAVLVFGSLLSGQACADGNSNKDQLTKSPTLEIAAIENSQGQTFQPDERISVACDRRLTVRLGPSNTTPYMLDNWIFRPPANCDEKQKQCGFVRLLLRYSDNKTVTVERASLAIVLSDQFVTSELQEVTATLIDGHDGSVFLVDDQAISDHTDLSLNFTDCPNSGSGGDGGGSDVVSDGGMGGMGGETGLGGSSLGGTTN